MAGRLVDQGERRGRRLLNEVGDELRESRVRGGLSQARAARGAGWSQSSLSRAERGLLLRATLLQLARAASVVGLDLVARCYPSDRGGIRDVAQLAVLAELKRRLGSVWEWQYEVPVGQPPDQRALDAVLVRGDVRIAVEVVTRLRDVRATLRDAHRKQLDGGYSRLLLVVPETAGNRAAIASVSDVLATALPVSSRAALAALAAGRDPGGDALLVLRAAARQRGQARRPVTR